MFIYRDNRGGDLRWYMRTIAAVNRRKFVCLYLTLTTLNSDLQNVSFQVL